MFGPLRSPLLISKLLVDSCYMVLQLQDFALRSLNAFKLSEFKCSHISMFWRRSGRYEELESDGWEANACFLLRQAPGTQQQRDGYTLTRGAIILMLLLLLLSWQSRPPETIFTGNPPRNILLQFSCSTWNPKLILCLSVSMCLFVCVVGGVCLSACHTMFLSCSSG